jgi:acyl carrier protein
VNAAVAPFDFRRWCETYPTDATLFGELGTMSSRAETAPEAFMHALLQVEVGTKRRELMEARVCAEIGEVLRLAPGRIARNKPLKSLGMDSLLTLELRNRLERSMGITISPTLLWNYPTVTALAPCLAEKMGISLEKPKDNFVAEPQEQPSSTTQDEVAGDDIRELLACELAAAKELLKAGGN